MSRHRFIPYIILLAGVLVVATSAILIRLAQAGGAPAPVVASWRLGLAAIILTPIAWQRRHSELRRLQRKDVGWGIAAGVFLAVHMATWVGSLKVTSVASATALGGSYPLWVALAVFLLFGQRPSRNTIIGLVAALTGSLLIAFSDSDVLVIGPPTQFNWQNLTAPGGKGDTALVGDGLALVGAITVACYFLIGRSLRTRLSTTAYVWLAYSSAAISLVVITLLAGLSLFSYSPLVYLWLLLLALGPQLLSHTAFNWALAYLSATLVTLSILGEPVGSAILAYLLFDEAFVPVQLVGFVLLLAGIGLGILGEQKRGGR